MFARLTRAGAALITALALVAALKELPRSVAKAHARVDETASLSALQREIAPAWAFGLDPTLVLRADERLPADAVYHVVTGEGLAAGHGAAAPFAAYWLLPRQWATEPREADWILAFGVDPAALGVEVEVVEDLGASGKLLRVRR